ncbi:MAG: enoyl-CoA hydratase-related protein [Gemmatimonadota bacterium]
MNSEFPAMSQDLRYMNLRREGGTATIELDHPPLNVLHIPMLQELDAVLAGLSSDPELKLLVLTATGKAFCAGVDVADHTAERVEFMIETFHSAIGRLLRFNAPVVGALNGAALGGGCELALACDVILASSRAKLGQPEIKLGVFPPVAAALLPRLVGRQRALDLILSGRVLRASEARDIGLVSQVAEPEKFDELVANYVAELASLSLPVLRLTKRAVVDGLDLPATEALAGAERHYLDDLMKLDDAREGLAAFLEKREPVWRDA